MIKINDADKSITSQEIARDFGVMCAFIEFAPKITEEERGDYLYKEFVKRTGLKISKEKLTEILEEEMEREYEIVASCEKLPSTTYTLGQDNAISIKSSIVDEFDIGETELPVLKVRVNSFKL